MEDLLFFWLTFGVGQEMEMDKTANISMSPSLAQLMTKAALKSDVNNSALFLLQPV